MKYLRFDFDTDTPEQNDQLIALLSEQRFEGFEEEEDGLQAFVREDEFDEREFGHTMDLFSSIRYIKSEVENINWNKQWESGFTPVTVDDFVAIRANFHAPVEGVAYDILITPKMSFGTGHHATTYLVVRLMKEINFKDKSVLDFGTGTGVLAILASKLGAKQVQAIDYDEWSITNASENIVQNNCNNIQVKEKDAVPAEGKFDVILANITLNVIMANLAAVHSVSAPGAITVFSGFLRSDEETLKTALQSAGLNYLSTMQRGDWIAVMAKKL